MTEPSEEVARSVNAAIVSYRDYLIGNPVRGDSVEVPLAFDEWLQLTNPSLHAALAERNLAIQDALAEFDKTSTRYPLPPMTEPSEEGKRRYPPDGYNTANYNDPGTPCTCKPDCPQACKGECGCEACYEAYGDFLSSRDD